jgi:hypothetical protein
VNDEFGKPFFDTDIIGFPWRNWWPIYDPPSPVDAIRRLVDFGDLTDGVQVAERLTSEETFPGFADL